MAAEDIRIAVRGNTRHNNDLVMVFDLRAGDVYLDDTLLALCRLWFQGLFNSIKPWVLNSTKYTHLSVARRGVNGVLGAVFLSGIDVSGTATANALPDQVAALVLGYTQTPRCIGKKFVGGLASNGVIDGSIEENFHSGLGAFGSWWKSTYTGPDGQTLTGGVWSKLHGGLKPITGITVPVFPSTQRRRKPGVGS